MPTRYTNASTDHRGQRLAWLDLIERDQGNQHGWNLDAGNHGEGRLASESLSPPVARGRYRSVIAVPHEAGGARSSEEPQRPALSRSSGRSSRRHGVRSTSAINSPETIDQRYNTIAATPREDGSVQFNEEPTQASRSQSGSGGRSSLPNRTSNGTSRSTTRTRANRPQVNTRIGSARSSASRSSNPFAGPRSPPRVGERASPHGIGSDCNICTYPIGQAREDDSVELGITLPCTHFFGHICLAQALGNGSRCPLCRRDITGANRRFLLGGIPQDGTTTGDRAISRGNNALQYDDEDAFQSFANYLETFENEPNALELDRLIQTLRSYNIGGTPSNSYRYDTHDAVSPRTTTSPYGGVRWGRPGRRSNSSIGLATLARNVSDFLLMSVRRPPQSIPTFNDSAIDAAIEDGLTEIFAAFEDRLGLPYRRARPSIDAELEAARHRYPPSYRHGNNH